MRAENALDALDSLATIHSIETVFGEIDKRLVDHGNRVAFVACTLNEAGKLGADEKSLLLLSVLHDIGAYKTEEIDRMVQFESKNVLNHSLYGYLFLHHMSPLTRNAKAILYHHSPWAEVKKNIKSKSVQICAGLIHLADRFDIVASEGIDGKYYKQILKNSDSVFNPEFVSVLKENAEKLNLFGRIADGSYKNDLNEMVKKLSFTRKETFEYVKLIVYSIDFRSEYTVTHTINTVSVAVNIAIHFGLPQYEVQKIYLGAFLHDVGKITIPVEILEFPGRLSPEKMDIMRTHVTETERFIRGLVPEDVFRIAVRHHEKLDGSGYPHGIRGDELTFNERIIAVADIVSALVNKRSYKEPFQKEKIISVLNEMSGEKLDSRICDYVCTEFDSIIKETDSKRDAVIKNYQSILSEFERLKAKFPDFEANE